MIRTLLGVGTSFVMFTLNYMLWFTLSVKGWMPGTREQGAYMAAFMITLPLYIIVVLGCYVVGDNVIKLIKSKGDK